MKSLISIASLVAMVGLFTACSTHLPQSESTTSTMKTSVENEFKRDPSCKVNADIERNQIPHTPNNMNLPSFGQGVIGWATGPEGAKARLESVAKADIKTFKDKGVTLEMINEWQAFYENEVQRNPCNPTAVFRAELMKKIAQLWTE